MGRWFLSLQTWMVSAITGTVFILKNLFLSNPVDSFSEANSKLGVTSSICCHLKSNRHECTYLLHDRQGLLRKARVISS